MAVGRVSILKGAMDLLILKALSWGPMHGYGVSHWIRQVTEDTFDIQEGVLAPLGRRQLRHELSTWARFAEAVGKIVRATEKPAWVQV